MVILKAPIKSGSQLFGQATCVFLHVALSKLQFKIVAVITSQLRANLGSYYGHDPLPSLFFISSTKTSTY